MNTHCLVSVGKVHLYQLRIIPMSPFLDDHLPSWKVIRFYFFGRIKHGGMGTECWQEMTCIRRLRFVSSDVTQRNHTMEKDRPAEVSS